ncbi:hypothetical protein [Weissella confusa]|uniref:hypothetical protein n=1 Tax=Weissella confusa TaxID=1583 RepID=UPI001EDF75AD|nr:hypothetical protein [Weissella confusa]
MKNPKAFNAEGYEFKQGTVNLQTADQVQAYMTQIDDTDLDASITRIQNVSMELYGNIQKIAHMKNLKVSITIEKFSMLFQTLLKPI